MRDLADFTIRLLIGASGVVMIIATWFAAITIWTQLFDSTQIGAAIVWLIASLLLTILALVSTMVGALLVGIALE